jgi:hypothetical protein
MMTGLANSFNPRVKNGRPMWRYFARPVDKTIQELLGFSAMLEALQPPFRNYDRIADLYGSLGWGLR